MQNNDNMIVQEDEVVDSGNTDLQVGSIAPGDERLMYAGRTIEFDTLITRDFLPLPDYRARCHSISYYTLCDGILYPINGFLSNHYKLDEVQKYLLGLRDATFPLGEGEDVLPQKYKKFLHGATENIGFILKELQTNKNLEALSNHANQLLNCLNNSIQNIRGDSGIWNSSVQTAFDPISWCYVQNNEVISSQANLTIKEPTTNYFPQGAPAAAGDGFYLTNPTDGIRLFYILNNTRGTLGKFIIYQARTRNDRRPFIYSSSNGRLPLPVNPLEYGSSLFYLYSSNWVKF